MNDYEDKKKLKELLEEKNQAMIYKDLIMDSLQVIFNIMK